MRDEFKRFSIDPWSFSSSPPVRRGLKAQLDWFPRLDMYEKNGNLLIEVELPGMKKEDIQVLVDNGDLVVQGDRKTESEVKEEDCYRLERSAGRFYRRIALPFEPKVEKIDVNFKEGVLEIRIPKPPEVKEPEPKKIPIH